MKSRYEYGKDEYSEEMERCVVSLISKPSALNLMPLRMVEELLAPDMRAGLNSHEKVAVGEIAAQLLNNQENEFGDSIVSDTVEQKSELDSLVVDNVKGLLTGVIDAIITKHPVVSSAAADTSSDPLGVATDPTIIVPTVIMVYDEDQEPNNSSSFSSTFVNSKSTFQNNSHLIVTDNGEVTIFLLSKDKKQKPGENHRGSETVQSMSSFSSSTGDFRNITFSQVSSTPEGFKKNGSNFEMSESSSTGMQFQNSTNQLVMDNENIFPILSNVDEESSVNNTKGEEISSNKTESLTENVSTSTTATSMITTVTTTVSTSTTMSTTTTTTATPGSTSTTTNPTTTTSTTKTTTTTPIMTTTSTTTTTISTTKKTTKRTTPAPPPTTTTPPPSLLQAMAQGVGAAMSTISGITAFNPLFLLLGRRRRRSFDKVDKITNDMTFSEQETLHFPSAI